MFGSAHRGQQARGPPWFRLILGVLLAVGAVVVVLQFVDPVMVWGVLAGARTDIVLIALGVVAIHYAAVGWRFATLAALFGIQVPEGVLVRTGIVSSALNRAVGFAGLVAHSIRIGVVRLWGGRGRDVVVAAVFNQAFQAMLTPALAILGAVLVFGLPPAPDPGWLLSTGGLVALLVVAGLTLTASRIGEWVSLGIEHLQARLAAGHLGATARNVHGDLVERIGEIRANPESLARPGVFMVLEPLTSLTVLFLAFWAIGSRLPPGDLVLAYAAVGVASMVSFVPGGLGIREGSMAGVLAWLGTPWDTALAGILLYRAMIDWLPALVTLPLGWGLVSGAATAEAA